MKKTYTVFYIKRGSLHLYRSLGLRDKMIVKIIQMADHNSYEVYFEAYRNFAPDYLPIFSNIEDYISHANTIGREEYLINDEK